MPDKTANDPTSKYWKASAGNLLNELAKKNQYLVGDMLVVALESRALGLDNYSSLGGVFKRAAKRGVIKKTSETNQKSNTTKTVWQSLIYDHSDQSPEKVAMQRYVMAALEFNADTVKLATVIYVNGELGEEGIKEAIKQFNSIQDQYLKKIDNISKDYEGES